MGDAARRFSAVALCAWPVMAAFFAVAIANSRRRRRQWTAAAVRLHSTGAGGRSVPRHRHSPGLAFAGKAACRLYLRRTHPSRPAGADGSVCRDPCLDADRHGIRTTGGVTFPVRTAWIIRTISRMHRLLRVLPSWPRLDMPIWYCPAHRRSSTERWRAAILRHAHSGMAVSRCDFPRSSRSRNGLLRPRPVSCARESRSRVRAPSSNTTAVRRRRAQAA
jgi:hypothetical protein